MLSLKLNVVVAPLVVAGLEFGELRGAIARLEGLIMLASPTPDYKGPAHHRQTCAAAQAWSSVPYIIDGVLVHVEDVQAHCRRARGAGARILSEPETDQYGTRYRAEDIEGHRWMFIQR
jgi:uncharacterized glyoxalase superfamily protein PhnB